MSQHRVYLIGGAPGAGKTTLGCALAARIGGSSVTVDDLISVAKTATTPDSHPGLYLTNGVPAIEYFTNASLAQMQADAEQQHEAIWPFVRNLIEKHFNWTTKPIVIDGWHLRPPRITAMHRDHLAAYWIHIDGNALEARERQNMDFYGQSPGQEKMFRNFMARSLWFNDHVRSEAQQYGFPVLKQNGTSTVDELCTVILDDRAGGASFGDTQSPATPPN